MRKTEGKRCATKQKKTEEQMPQRDYEESLLTDINSKIESIWYSNAVCREKIAEEFMPFG